MVAKMMGDSICGQLAEWGETPRSVTVINGGSDLILGFEIISAEPKWRKTIDVPVTQKAPEVLDQLNAWRERVRAELHAGKPSDPVILAIACFGTEAVNKALEHRARG